MTRIYKKTAAMTAALIFGAVAAHAVETINQVVMSDTFDTYAAGALLTNSIWNPINPEGLKNLRKLDVKIDAGNLMGAGTSNQILFFQNTAASPGTYRTTMTADGLTTSHVAMVSFDFHEPSSIAGGISIYVGGDSGASSPINGFSLSDGTITPSGSYTLNAPHHLDAVFNETQAVLTYADPAGGSSTLDPGLMDIWIDNMRVAAGATHARAGTPAPAITSLFLTNDGVNQEIYLDNITVQRADYTPPPPFELQITNQVVSAGSVLIEWNEMSDRYIVVASDQVDGMMLGGTCVASGATPASSALFTYDAATGFFRISSGIATVDSIVNPVLWDEVKIQSAANAPTSSVYDVDLENINGMTLPGQDVAVSELGDFTNLDKLSLAGSSLTTLADLTPVSGLTWLNLSSNLLSDVSGLAVLADLEALNLDQNQISDLSGIESLSHLRWLDLENNQLTDLSLVVSNAVNGGLGEDDELWVRGNPLGATATNQILYLETNYNVRVYY